jgi:hypothetical protein
MMYVPYDSVHQLYNAQRVIELQRYLIMSDIFW